MSFAVRCLGFKNFEMMRLEEDHIVIPVKIQLWSELTRQSDRVPIYTESPLAIDLQIFDSHRTGSIAIYSKLDSIEFVTETTVAAGWQVQNVNVSQLTRTFSTH